MSPKFVDKTEKINEIAKTALHLFSQKGFSATSVEQIAESAGIGKGTVYEYFNSKDEIFVYAISNWIMDAMNRVSDGTRAIADPVRRFNTFIEMIREVFTFEDPKTVKLFIEIDQQTFMEGGAFFKRRHILKEMRSRFCRIIADILLDGVSKKVFRPEIARDVNKIAINLMAYLDGIGMHYLITEQYQELEGQIDFYIENFIQSIRVKPEKFAAGAAVK